MEGMKKRFQVDTYALKNSFRRVKRRAGAAFSRLSGPGRAVLFGGGALVLAALALVPLLLPRKGKAEETAQMEAAASYDMDIRIAENPAAAGASARFAPEAALAPAPTEDPGFRRGVENEIVQVIQERLMELGYLEIDESTQKYGPQTEAAVQLFQRQLNFTEGVEEDVVEDGVCGAQTLAYLFADDAPKYTVKFGMEGDDVTAMQMQLKDLGYMSATTGYYGEKTVEAMREFQGRNGLEQDGLAGELSFDLLYSPEARESRKLAQTARTKANIDTMIEVAKDKLGCKYILGNTGPNSFDCSGLVYYCLREAGSNRRRLNAAGYSRVEDWTKLSSMSELKRGDLIFFYNNAKSKVGHVGIVVREGEMIDASSSNGKVVRRSYTTSYWRKHFVCGRRPW